MDESRPPILTNRQFIDLLGCKCLVMHKKEINIARVVDEEGFVTRGH